MFIFVLFPVSSKSSYVTLGKGHEGHDIKFLTQGVLK